jgi:NAD(P)-dependent dehydrogenase (short-subunit alcohol dehydrogenase family)
MMRISFCGIGQVPWWHAFRTDRHLPPARAGRQALGGHQKRQVNGPQHVAADTAQQKFAHARVSIEAEDHEICADPAGMTLDRRGKPEEVAAAVVFLCSERASFINGAGIRVDSGSVATIAG